MEKRQIGQSDLFVSPLTLGCMSLGSNLQEAKEIIHTATDRGINHLDTADLYGFGANEAIVGEAIKKKRKELILTSKVGNHFDANKKSWFWDPSPTYIEHALDASLSRLQTDYLDLYLLHGGTIEDPIDGIIDTFERLKEKGKIRAYGISSIRPNVINEYIEKSNIDAIMMQYNIFDNRPESLFSLMKDKGISVLARGPLAKGILSHQSAKQIERKAYDGYLTYSQETLAGHISSLKSSTHSLTRLAFQYVLHEPLVATAVFGASSLEQVEENTGILHDLELDVYTNKWIQNNIEKMAYTNHLIKGS